MLDKAQTAATPDRHHGTPVRAERGPKWQRPRDDGGAAMTIAAVARREATKRSRPGFAALPEAA
jgi:hypothetical protein